MLRKMLVLATVVLLGSAAAFTQDLLPRAGSLPAGTEIAPLRTPEARHYSNGDGTVTAVLDANRPSLPRAFAAETLSYSYYCFTEYLPLLGYGVKVADSCYTGWQSLYGYLEDLERGQVEWSVSTIPAGSTINSVRCSTYCAQSGGYSVPTTVYLYEMAYRPSTTTDAATLHTDAGDGTNYGSISPVANTWKARDLTGASALLQERLTNGGWFAVGYMTTQTTLCEVRWQNPRLVVNYTPPASHDVACVSVLVPVGVFDSGVTVTPACTVYNYGTASETFNVRVQIPALSYNQLVAVNGLAPNTGIRVNAPPVALNRPRTARFAVRCSTELAGDGATGNDRRVDSAWLRVVDAQSVAILYPGANVDSGVAVTPSVRVRNNGTGDASFNVHCWADDGYTSTQALSISPGEQDIADFDQWTPTLRGANALHCATLLAGDLVRSNDTVHGSTFVNVRDARPVTIDVPATAIDSSGPLTPRVTVENRGNVAATFDVEMTIGNWSGGATVANLAAGATAQVDMTTQWQPTRGHFVIAVTTRLAGDMVPANDVLDGWTDVNVRDVGVTGIIAPASPLTEGDVVTPRVSVANHGTDAATADIRLIIRNSGGAEVYSHDLAGVVIPPAGIADLPFSPDWTAGTAGGYTTQAFTMLAGDLRPGNDSAGNAFAVDAAGTRDVAVAAITVPAGTIDTGATVVPRAWVANRGTLAATFDAWFRISRAGGEVYSSSEPVAGLAPGESTELAFDGWAGPRAPGDYVARCSVSVAGDVNPADDTMSRAFAVAARPDWPAGWHAVEPMPAGTAGKQVKDGGWLSFHAAGGLVYAAKGNKQRDFFAYDAVGDTWTRKPDVPPGIGNKPSGKGAAGCSDGAGSIFATKGNNTLEFYRFSTAVDSWYPLEAVPAGINKVKGGTDLAYVTHGDSQYVYLLKGYKNEFYRYNVGSGHWEPLAGAPSGAGVKYDKGSWLVHDGGNRLYVHQAKYHRLYAYDLAGAAWTTTPLTGMPTHSGITGRNKKSKDGGCAAWSNGGIYALKGGNTQEYWRYYPAGDSWAEFDTLPQWTASTGRKKKVKAGSDITSYSDGILFALKGNKTLECWRWVDYPTVCGSDIPVATRDGALASGRLAIDDCRLTIAPNPMSGSRVLHLTTGPLGHSTTISIYDALGRLVLTRLLDHWTTSHLDVRSLSAGVYLVKLSADGFSASQKLVIEK